MKKTLLKVAIIIVLTSTVLLSFAENDNTYCPIINLSNFGSGEWILASDDEEADSVIVYTDDFYMDDVEVTLERMFVFSFYGKEPGLSVVSIEYRRDDEVMIRLCVKIIVDSELNVHIDEVTVLPGLYEGYI